MSNPPDPESFDPMYLGTPPWDIGRPQPVFEKLASDGALGGRVLDAGCGTGEHTLMAASLGLDATGIDSAPKAIEIAERKAKERSAKARFIVMSAFDLGSLGEEFDILLDSGLFHVFDDDDRIRYIDSLRTVTSPGARLHLLCFSEFQPGTFGPRRVTQAEIKDSFAPGWVVESIEAATFEITIDPHGARAWLASITRT